MDYIQKCGILPDRYFSLPASSNKLKEKYNQSYNAQDAEKLLNRNRLEYKELVDNLGEMLDELPLSLDDSTVKLNATLSIKAKKIIPYDSPRAIFIHPPYIQPQTVKSIVDRFSLHHITVGKSLNKLSGQPKFN